MQVPSIMTDLMEFKDEIFKKIRLLEKKLMDEIKTKYSQLSETNQKLDNKITFINDNTDSLLDFVTSQKLNIEKVGELELSTNKAEQNISMHEMKLKNLALEINKMKSKYDKIFEESLQVPGYIGPACQFKNISEYIQNNILEFSKLKNDRDQIKIENIEVKNRLDNILKSTLNLIDSTILRCQNYADNKHENMKNILNNKLVEVSEKNMELRAQISKNELQNERQIEKMKIDIEKLSQIKNELATLIGQNIEEINDKIQILNDDINSIKIKNESIEKEKESKMKSKKNDIDNSNETIFIKSSKKSNYKLQKIPIIQNKQLRNINEINRRQNKEDKKINLSDDYSKNFETIIPKNLKNNEKCQIFEEKTNDENNSIEERSIKNNVSKYLKIKNLNEKINQVIKMNEFSPSKIKQPSVKYEGMNVNIQIKEEFANKYNVYKNDIDNTAKDNIYKNNIDNMDNKANDNIINQNNRDTSILFKNKNKKSEKIKIESLEKEEISPSNSTQNIKSFNDKEKGKIKDSNQNIPNKIKTLFAGKTFSKINITNKANTNRNKISKTRDYELLEKSKKNNSAKNREQNRIMKEIKTFYNEKKEKNEQKSQENPVTCNIINLHLEKPSSKVNRNESAKIVNDYKENNQNNYIKELGMKVNPAFGRTTYSFYNKNGLNVSEFNSYNENEFEKNIKYKNKSLKDKINIAFVSSIQKKIHLNEKNNNNN